MYYIRYLFVGDIDFKVWHKTVLKNLGNKYQLFFKLLSFKTADIETARMNNNQDAANTVQELWEQ